MINEENYNLDEEVKLEILGLLQNDSREQLEEVFLELHPADQSELISSLALDLREKILLFVGANIDAQFLSYLENDLKNQVIEFLGAKNSAKAINKLDIDVAVEIVEDLEKGVIDEILKHVPDLKKIELKAALSYDDNTIGRVMHQDFIAIHKDWNVSKATSYLQNHLNLPDDFQYVIIVDNNYSPISEISVSTILVNKKNILISDIMMKDVDVKKINVNSDQEDAARLFSKYSLTYAPVVDVDGILVGAVSISDIVDVIEEEAQEDLLLLGGVNDKNLYSSSFWTAKSRIPWLFTSLITTSMAVIIIALFSDQIQKAVVLAVLLPIVASLAGNAGTQSLTVLVRTIATNEVDNIGATKILFKETWVGSINGLFLSVIAAIVCYCWQKDIYLSIVLAFSIFTTVILSGFFGAVIPLLLNKMKFDPAISSGVFLIAITDTSSFLIFLGLASIFIL